MNHINTTTKRSKAQNFTLHGVVSKIYKVHAIDFSPDFSHAEGCFWFARTNALESYGITEHKRKLFLYSIFSEPLIYINSLTIKNDKHLISLHNITLNQTLRS